MRWVSAVSEDDSLERAVAECAAAIQRQLQGPPDLAVAFVSEHHAAHYAQLPLVVEAALEPRHWIGCSAGGVIGGGHEVERAPGFSLTAAYLPGTTVAAFPLKPASVAAARKDATAWRALVGVQEKDEPDFLLLADPFTFEAEECIRCLDAVYPAARKAGGLASGGRQPGANAIYLDGRMLAGGAVGVALTGDTQIETVVAQGCRPIGLPMFVTRCERNILQALDGRPPYEVLAQLYAALDARDRELFQHSLFLGVVMRPEQQQYAHGDFLIRNLLGVDSTSGSLAIGALLQERMVVQFHLRDADTSRQDLVAMLSRYRRDHADAPRGALLFSCLGRGRFLYGRADHDTEVFREQIGPVPLGGFFCNGEIGPVHGQTFLHGYTSSFALFRDRKG
jgi:small ligand-binding sensory domain FIST